MADHPNFIANGNVLPSTFVKLDPSVAMPSVINTSATSDLIIGVSKESTDQAGFSLFTGTQYAAIAGENCRVYQVGDSCMLSIGSGGVTQGDMISSDASGNGQTAASGSGKRVGAIALMTAAANTLCRVRVTDPFLA